MIGVVLVAALSCSDPAAISQLELLSREYNMDQVDLLFPHSFFPKEYADAAKEVERVVYKWKNIQEISPGVCSAEYQVDTINLLTGAPLVTGATVKYRINGNEVEFISEK